MRSATLCIKSLAVQWEAVLVEATLEPEMVTCPMLVQAGALAEACKSYAAEARRLAATAAAEDVAAQFAELQQTLEGL